MPKGQLDLDHQLLDRFRNATLRSYGDGDISLMEAETRLAHAFAIVASGNGDVQFFMKASLESDDA